MMDVYLRITKKEKCFVQLSGGERRRLSVAIGLVRDPRVILLNEPTTGLDSETATQLIRCLVRLARTVLYLHGMILSPT